MEKSNSGEDKWQKRWEKGAESAFFRCFGEEKCGPQTIKCRNAGGKARFSEAEGKKPDTGRGKRQATANSLSPPAGLGSDFMPSSSCPTKLRRCK